MIDLQDVWVGDLLRQKSTGEMGRYEGARNNQALVNLSGRVLAVDVQDLELVDEQDVEEEIFLDQDESPAAPKANFTNVIDLHLEALPPYDPRSGVSEIEFQMRYCLQFMQEVVRRKLSSATIIHGKGRGILKQEVMHLLDGFDEVRFSIPTHDGGAVEILMQY